MIYFTYQWEKGDTKMSKNTEIELKLLLSDEDLKKLLQLDFVKASLREESKTVRQLSSSYYDTKDMVFRNHGIAYRVRDKGDGGFEATVKATLKKQGGLAERIELNIPLTENKAVLEGFKELGFAYELTDLAPQGVEKLFSVDVKRTTYLLDYEGAVIELAVDKGFVIAGASKDEIDEIELELKDGEAQALLNFAQRAGKEVTLKEEERSKYARGLALCKLL